MKKRSAAAGSSQITLDLGDPGTLFPVHDLANGDSGEDDGGIDYPIDPSDDLPAEGVKPHCRDKHELLRKYIDICSAVRNKQAGWAGSNCYIDLYSGPGRVRFNDDGKFADGSPLIAWDTSTRLKNTRDSRFAACFIGELGRETRPRVGNAAQGSRYACTCLSRQGNRHRRSSTQGAAKQRAAPRVPRSIQHWCPAVLRHRATGISQDSRHPASLQCDGPSSQHG